VQACPAICVLGAAASARQPHWQSEPGQSRHRHEKVDERFMKVS
jgi:hypothetical protein